MTANVSRAAMAHFLVYVALLGSFTGVPSAEASPFAYVTNFNARVVSVVDLATNAVVANVAVLGEGTGVAVNSDGTRVYIATNPGVLVIDTQRNVAVKAIGVGLGSVGVALNPAGTRLFVGNPTSDSVYIFDTSTYENVATLSDGIVPYGITANASGTRVYVAEQRSNYVSVLDTSTNLFTRRILLGSATGPTAVAVSADGSRIYVASQDGSVTVADTAQSKPIATIPVGTALNGIALNPAGTRAYASDDAGKVAVIDTATNSLVSTIQVGGRLIGIAVAGDGAHVYVADNANDQLVVIDTSTNAVVQRIPVGSQPIAFGQFIGGNIEQNYQGLWWASPAGSESGWGINFAHQGDTIFATWFTYDTTGKAWWLSMTATKTAPNVYSGALVQTNGPAFSAMPFDPSAVTHTVVGNATLTFADANTAQFTYTVNGVTQTKTLIREAFGVLPICTFGTQPNLALATNYQDLWWASPAGSESGWGINLTEESGVIFGTWFTYDVDGSPLWLSVTATNTAPGIFTGTLLKTSGPSFSAVPFDPNKVMRTEVGPATFAFRDGANATFSYTVGNVSQVKTITREVFVSPGTTCQ